MNASLSRRFAITCAALLAGLSLGPVAPATAEPTPADTAVKYDGKTSETAAASCFEIKQNDPQAPSGSYWLYTPAMSAPAQFYCDQETDGGGWVMIGRGREGWTDTYDGKGDPAQLATNPDGTDAFKPVQLPSKTVDALLNGQAPSQMQDGLRLHRALNAEGTQWQEATATRAQIQHWSWALSSFANWKNISYFYGPGSASNRTYATSMDRIDQHGNTNSITFAGRKVQNWNLGFGYGGDTRLGSTDPGSYIYSASADTGYPIPFTQAFLRPRVTQADLATSQIPDSGAPASARRALPNSYSQAMLWRTSQETGTGNVGEMNTNVQAITEVNGTVFTGGDFKNLVSASGEVVDQSFLAGFDVQTGQLVRGFTPKFNGQVKALAPLPNGKLAVGGEFTEVNGQPVSNLVILDPATGAVDTTWDWRLENRNTGGVVTVSTLDVQGNYLYVGGTFTHAKGNTSSVAAYSKYATRFRLDNGGVDWKWRPIFNGSVNGINASADGTQVFAAGYFSTVNNEPAFRLASLNTVDAARTAQWDWKQSYDKVRSSSYNYQFDVQDVGSAVFTAGSEHLIASYDKNTFARKSSSITRNGGDFQDLSYSNGVVYGACHCGDGMYQGAETWMGAWDEASDVHQIRLLGAWDSETGAFLPEFNPQLKGFRGDGVWESFTDSTGTLWVGGDIAQSLGAYGVQNTVGFARFAPRDVTPASVPTNLQVTTENGRDRLTWTGVAEGGTTYQVLRDDRVIATVKGTSYEVDHRDGARYFVRSEDVADNYSASTPVATAAAPATAPAPTA